MKKWSEKKRQDALQAVKVDQANLADDAARLPHDLLRWYGVLAETQGDVLQAKLAREAEEARMGCLLLRQAKEGGDKQPAEWVVQTQVRADPQYAKLGIAEAEAVAERGKVSGVVQALRAKRRVLDILMVGGRGYGDDEDDSDGAEVRTHVRQAMSPPKEFDESG